MLGLEIGTALGEGDIKIDEIGAGVIVPDSPGEPGAIDESPDAIVDFAVSEQRGHVVIVLVVKLVSTMMEVVPLRTLVVVTGQLVTVV